MEISKVTSKTFTIEGESPPVLSGDSVITGFSDGSLVSLNCSDGNIKWERDLLIQGGDFIDVDTNPLILNNTIYVSSFSDGIFAVDKEAGKILWVHNVQGASTPIIIENTLIFSTVDHEIRKISLADGHLIWKKEYHFTNLTAPLLLNDLILLGHDQGISLIRTDNGNMIRVIIFSDGIASTPVSVDGVLYFISNSGCLNALKVKS